VKPPITVILLPGGDKSHIDKTLGSVRDELGSDTDVIDLVGEDRSAKLAGASPGKDQVFAFVRAGDRLVPGSFAARMLTFGNYPAAGISLSGYLLTGPDGEPVRRVKAPLPGTQPDEILLRRNVEAAAVLVRGSALTSANLELLKRPHADIVVWSRIADESGYQVSGESAAFIPLDPNRHGQSATAKIATLSESVAASSGPDRSGDSTLRRELLRRLYLAPEDLAEAIDLADLFSGKFDSVESTAAVISDLQWIAERQSEALQLERVRWAEGEIREEDSTPLTVSEEIVEAQARLGEMGARLAQLENVIRRLEAEIYRRDTIISDLMDVPLHEAREVAEAAEEGQS